MKAVRRGDMKPNDIKKWFEDRVPHLENLYNGSKVVPHSPPQERIKVLLMECLEEHYGSLDKMGVVNPDASVVALREFVALADKHRSLLEQPHS